MELAKEGVAQHYNPPYVWRLFATALSFSLFGIGGLILRIVVFPLIHLCVKDQQKKQAYCRLAVHKTFKFFVGFMNCSGVLFYDLKGAERLGQPGQMIIANHPSLIDVVLIIAQVKNANCIVKQSIWHNPFMRGPVRAANYISNNGSIEMFDESVQVLQQGQTLIIFPEGTRTTPGKAPEFHRGAASIALKGARVITPVLINVSPTTLTKAEPWYKIPARRVHFTIEVGEDINPNDFLQSNNMPKASRQLNTYLHDYFLKELTQHESIRNTDQTIDH
ncbi:lysophospholipid acyltransferase family protein [Pseudomonas sp. F1_0610]|uniref:lysophospholipid acyltransferase family protein n=1 Tax=Pseudomonas sp. F1_0610 TaxID=3114284 RepID=UPI0039C0FC13